MAKDYNISLLFTVKDDGTPEIKKLSMAFEELGKASQRSAGNVEKGAARRKKVIAEEEKTRKKIESQVKGIGASVGQYVGLAAGAMAFRDMAKTGMEFNEAMANVGTLIPGNLDRLNALKKGVRDTSLEMGISHNEMASGLYEVVSAFGDTNESIDRLKFVAMGAKAGGATMQDTLNLLSQTTKAYGDESAEALQKSSDLAFTAVKLGQTSFPALAQAMAKVVPTAAQLKLSQEELYTVMATFTRGAATTPMIVDQLSAALTKISAPTEAMKAKIESLGFESGSTMLATKGLAETIRLLTDSGKATPEMLKELFQETNAVRFAMGFSGPQMQVYLDKLDQMRRAGGTTAAAFNEQVNGINESGASMAKMKVALDDLKVSFWDLAAGPMGSMFESLAAGVKAVSGTLQNWRDRDVKNEKLVQGLRDAGRKNEEIDQENMAKKLGYTSAAQWRAHGAGAESISQQELSKNASAYAREIDETRRKSDESLAETRKMEVKIALPTDDEGNPIIMANAKVKGGSVRTTGYRETVQ